MTGNRIFEWAAASLLAVVWMTSGSHADDSLMERLPAMDRAVLDNRKAMKSFELRITRTDDNLDRPQLDSKSELYFRVSGSKVYHTVSHPTIHRPNRIIYCRNCEADGYVMDLQDADPKVPANVSLAPLNRLSPDSLNNRIPEPRTLGLIVDRFGAFAPQPIDTLVGRADRKNLAVASDTIDGQAAVRVSFRFQTFANVVYWIVPALGNSVTRIEFTNDSGGKSILVSKVKRWEPSGIWFPQSTEYTEFWKDKLRATVTCNVDVISINERIDPERFKIPALDLPAGTHIYEIPPLGETKVWTGTALIDPNEPPQIAPIPGPTPPGRTSKWLMWAAFAMGAAALIVGLELLRRRRSSQS